MQSFGDNSAVTQSVNNDNPKEIRTWDDPSAWTPEVDEPPLPSRIPEAVPEADVLEQSLPA